MHGTIFAFNPFKLKSFPDIIKFHQAWTTMMSMIRIIKLKACKLLPLQTLQTFIHFLYSVLWHLRVFTYNDILYITTITTIFCRQRKCNWELGFYSKCNDMEIFALMWKCTSHITFGKSTWLCMQKAQCMWNYLGLAKLGNIVLADIITRFLQNSHTAVQTIAPVLCIYIYVCIHTCISQYFALILQW